MRSAVVGRRNLHIAGSAVDRRYAVAHQVVTRLKRDAGKIRLDDVARGIGHIGEHGNQAIVIPYGLNVGKGCKHIFRRRARSPGRAGGARQAWQSICAGGARWAVRTSGARGAGRTVCTRQAVCAGGAGRSCSARWAGGSGWAVRSRRAG